MAYRRGGAVAGIDFGFVGQDKKLFFYTVYQLRHAAVREVGPADGIGEKSVAHERDAVLFRVETNAARRMTRRVEDEQFYAGLFEYITFGQTRVFRLCRERNPRHLGQILLGPGEHFGVELVNIDLHVGKLAA